MGILAALLYLKSFCLVCGSGSYLCKKRGVPWSSTPRIHVIFGLGLAGVEVDLLGAQWVGLLAVEGHVAYLTLLLLFAWRSIVGCLLTLNGLRLILSANNFFEILFGRCLHIDFGDLYFLRLLLHFRLLEKRRWKRLRVLVVYFGLLELLRFRLLWHHSSFLNYHRACRFSLLLWCTLAIATFPTGSQVILKVCQTLLI